MHRRQLLKKAKRIVVKIGTALLTSPAGTLNRRFIAKLTGEIAALKQAGTEIVVVSSGAVGAGMLATGSHARPRTIPAKQAMAAIGQPRLMQAYAQSFKRLGIMTAQVLLTSEDINHRQRYSNARNALFELLRMDVIPIINENDTVAVKEIKFGDNDELSAQVTSLVEADALIILTDVDGLFTSDPGKDKDARLIHQVDQVTAVMAQRVQATSSINAFGTGGMVTKLEAAKKVTKMGEEMVIANGRRRQVLQRIMAGEEIGTIFYPQGDKLAAKKRWIGFALKPKGRLGLDKGAAKAVREGGKSLLPSGIRTVSEEAFSQGDCVSVCDEQGREFAQGLVKYSAEEIRKIMGLKSAEIQQVLGYKNSDEVIHRDDLVIHADDGGQENLSQHAAENRRTAVDR